jgi:hypothetical protein
MRSEERNMVAKRGEWPRGRRVSCRDGKKTREKGWKEIGIKERKRKDERIICQFQNKSFTFYFQLASALDN